MKLVIARVTPFKNIFFTTGHSLFFACVILLVWKAHNFSDVAAIIVGGLLLGFFSAALPYL
ncbi:PTS transporter subunit IIC [Enterococcus faecalis]|uniref:PTS transporter subunit IIC n=1 Tax=Enterococcus faecalis TaxID=1351 RepID=UPI003DA17A49